MRITCLLSVVAFLVFCSGAQAAPVQVEQVVDPDGTGERIEQIGSQSTAAGEDLERVSKQAGEKLRDELQESLKTISNMVQRIQNARERYNKYLSPESQLEMIINIRRALDEALEADLIISPTLVDDPMDAIDNAKERLTSLADESVERNRENLEFRLAAMRERVAQWKRLDAKAQAGTISEQERRELDRYGRWIRDTHNMVQMTKQQLKLFENVRDNISAVISEHRQVWADAANYIADYNMVISNLDEVRRLYRSAEEVKRIGLLANADILRYVDNLSDASRELTDVASGPMMEFFSGGDPVSVRPQVDVEKVDRDQVLEIMEQY